MTLKNKQITIFFFLILHLVSCNRDNNSISKGFIKTKKNQHLTCYFFFIPDCPVCKNNFYKVLSLRNKYETRGLEIKAIYSDPFPDSIELKKMVKENSFEIPITIDKDLKIASKFNVRTTPQFILLNESNQTIYNGMIDNYYYLLGKHRNIITRNYLEDAILSALNGTTIETTITESIGCKINYQLTKNK